MNNSHRKSMARRAFTLIELLVVIAIIALLIGILLPALGEARLAARSAVDGANLASIGKVTFLYGAEYKDALINPFNKKSGEIWAGYQVVGDAKYQGLAVDWYFSIEPTYAQTRDQVVYGNFYPDDRWCTMAFGVRYASWFSAYLKGTKSAVNALALSPSDRWALQRFEASKRAARSPNNGSTPGGSSPLGPDERSADYDASYYMSPTLWLKPDTFMSQFPRAVNRLGTLSNPAAGINFLRYNRIDEINTPALKVLHWTRLDFAQRRRNTGTSIEGTGNTVKAGTIDRPPQWNNPGARPKVTAADGSVKIANMLALSQASASEDLDIRDIFRPSGPWNPSEEFLYSCGYLGNRGAKPEDDLELEAGAPMYPQSNKWQAFFWATRKGVRGQDLQK